MIIEIGNKIIQVTLAETEEEHIQGLQGKKSLPLNEGMLFVYEEPQTVGFWMKDTLIPLDIIFINEDCEVISVVKGEPMSEEIHEEDNVLYVLELNQNSGIEEGDELDMEDDEESMKVLDEEGKVQMTLDGGERIFSRKNTKTLIKMAKRADKTKLDKHYKALGKKMFTFIETQDVRDPEYVNLTD